MAEVSLEAVYERLGGIDELLRRVSADMQTHLAEDRVFHLQTAERITNLEARNANEDRQVEHHGTRWHTITSIGALLVSLFALVSSWWGHH